MPVLDVVSIIILVPTLAALALVAWFGKETRGRDLRDLTSAENGSSETVALSTLYSLIIPGSVKPRLAGFIMSMTRAMTGTPIRIQWAFDSGASSGGDTTMSWLVDSNWEMFFGKRP